MGLTKEQILERDKSLQRLQITTYKDKEGYVFVSYKSDNWKKVFEEKIFVLQKNGLRVYSDKNFDDTNHPWLEDMDKNLKYSSAILMFISKEYLKSYATLIELLTAIRYSKQIIPVCFEEKYKLFDELTSDVDLEDEIVKMVPGESQRLSELLELCGSKTYEKIINKIKIKCSSKIAQEKFTVMDIVESFQMILTEADLKDNLFDKDISSLIKTIKDAANDTNNKYKDVFDEQCAVADNIVTKTEVKTDSIVEKNDRETQVAVEEPRVQSNVSGDWDAHNYATAMASHQTYSSNKNDVLTSDKAPVVINASHATYSPNRNDAHSTFTPQEVYFLNARAEINGTTGYYVLKKGSIIVAKTADSCPDKAKRLREESIRNGELVARGIDYELTVDKVFKSASGAATYVCGYSVSGTTAWKAVPTSANYGTAKVFEDPFETYATSEKKESWTEWDTSDLYVTKTKKSSLPEMIQEGKVSVGAELYVKGHNKQIATLTADGKIAYQGSVMSLNQFVLLILGPGSRNAYLFVCEKESGLTLNELRDGADVKKKITDDFEPMQEVKPAITDSTLTIGDIRRKLADRNTAFAFRQVREDMPRGGKGAMDYAMATILGGCNSINVNSPIYQINYYTYAVADFENKKEDGGLGATWTWSSNCRKVLGLEKAGQIPTEIDVYFKYLSEDTSLKEIEDAFYKGFATAYQTKKNDMVMYAIKKIYEFFA